MFADCYKKKRGCHTVVNMALSQLFWDVLMPWNLKSTYFSLKIIHFLSLNIWYVIYVVFWIKYWNLKLPHHCILFLFTICTVSQLFWNRVCMFTCSCNTNHLVLLPSQLLTHNVSLCTCTVFMWSIRIVCIVCIIFFFIFYYFYFFCIG